jgi:hypothetical protein
MRVKKPFIGTLLERIRPNVIISRDPAKRAASIAAWQNDVCQQMAEKLPDVATHFGIEWQHLDLTDARNQAIFYRSLAIRLCQEIPIPAFRPPAQADKYPPALVAKVLDLIERTKQADKAAGKPPQSDFQITLPLLRFIDPENSTAELSKGELKSRARTWCNHVAALRSSIRRQQENKIN